MIEDVIRNALVKYGHLAQDPMTISGDADLYGAGLTSHASVNLMLAIEDELDIEFPESLLRKSTFSSINVLRDSLTELGVGVSS